MCTITYLSNETIHQITTALCLARFPVIPDGAKIVFGFWREMIVNGQFSVAHGHSVRQKCPIRSFVEFSVRPIQDTTPFQLFEIPTKLHKTGHVCSLQNHLFQNHFLLQKSSQFPWDALVANRLGVRKQGSWQRWAQRRGRVSRQQ